MRFVNIKKIYVYLHISLCLTLIAAASCGDDEQNIPGETTVGVTIDDSEVTTTEVDVDERDYTAGEISYKIEAFDNPRDHYGYRNYYDSTNYIPSKDKGYLLKNGYVLVIEERMTFNEHQYGGYYLYSMNGKRPEHPEYDPINGFYLLIETNDGKYIVNEGDTVVYDSEWNLIETLDANFSYAYPLDNGRYFAVNDTWTKQYFSDFLTPGIIWERLPERFSLYRYTEKLTESEFAEIRAVDGGFECVYPEDSEKSGEILFYPVDDMVPFDEQYFTLVYDEESEQYYYLDVAGNKLFDMNFDFACEPTNNSAVVRVDKDYYVIQAIAQD